MRTRPISILLLIVIAGLSAILIKSAVLVTAPYIEKNTMRSEQESVLNIFKIDYTRDTREKIFAKKIKKYATSSGDIYKYFDPPSKLRGTAFKMKGMGFWGTITALCALAPDLKTITGFAILEHTETPGLGGRITDESFLASFNGKKAIPYLTFTRRSHNLNDYEIQAITGATQTSKALERIISDSMQSFLRERVVRQR